jgi:bifunctional UDP-N-acetylglucosamine pyrophosphorylase/glucosamine-1-phosphate N-acetyltransferase
MVNEIARPLYALILAAGKGTRMKSPLPKVMHKIGGQPLLGFVLSAVRALALEGQVGVVLSPTMQDVAAYCQRRMPGIQIFWQTEQLGTAHAVRAAEAMLDNPDANVLILLGDVPFIKPTTLHHMLAQLEADPLTGAVVLAMHERQPNTYGRLVKDETGKLVRIVEIKEAAIKEKDISLCHSGFFAVKGTYVLDIVQQIQPSSTTGEYYLTDMVDIMSRQGLQVAIVETDPEEVQGINTQMDLAQAESYFQHQRRQQALADGVTLIDPASVYFSYNTQIAAGVTVHPHVVFAPDVSIEEGAEIFSFSHLEGVSVHAGAKVGPFARIRPHSVIQRNGRVGNFVELKNTVLGVDSKINHLAYAGDCTIGNQCNIGAGSITVNYDGANKWHTFIKDGAFIGSNSALVAPLTIGEGAIIAAGSTITQDVDKDALAFGRARQVEIKGGAHRIRQNVANKKKKGN